jgi:hypothetical protein
MSNWHLAFVWIPLMTTTIAQAPWAPKPGPLMTRWAADVKPDNVHPEYPRPQMVRTDWQNLNGLWEYAVRPKTEDRPAKFDGQILVPFPIESALSGVMQRVDENQRVWYRRTFEVPASWAGKNVLLHFGAVDWEATVWVNGKQFDPHRGGYDPFTLDITDALQSPSGSEGHPHELVVCVWDPTDAGNQPRGKQVRKPEGIWYTATTGIWQTVWLEPVPAAYIRALRVNPRVRLDGKPPSLGVQIQRSEAVGAGYSLDIRVYDGDQEVAQTTEALRDPASWPSGAKASNVWAGTHVDLPNAKLWSPDSPHLYGLKIRLLRGTEPVDEVTSYAGLRDCRLAQDDQGRTRIFLNGQPFFMFGPLDQGFWPDGLYTAPTDEALRYDIEVLKKLGCNVARKHVKVEPDRWYYWCDKLGLLVWQDMPSGDKIDAPKDYQRTPESAAQFKRELNRMTDTLFSHPCIVMWVPFNEGWGQYDTKNVTAALSCRDYSYRLIDAASGWHETGDGDVHDIHDYPGPSSPMPEPKRAAVLGEFGGLGLPLAGHTWQAEKNWGYRSFQTPEELTDAYLNLLANLRLLIADRGLSAAIYTQTTDVEIEVNGLMTYDRAIIKPDADRIATANRRLYAPPPTVKTICPTAQDTAQPWRYTTTNPPDNWMSPDFPDSHWPQAPAPFGHEGTPGVTIRTPWDTADIWLRRQINLQELPASPCLKLYHDEDCEVFINGKPVATAKGYTTSYVLVPITDKSALRQGLNTIAAHCHQTTGGQGIDIGLVDVIEAPRRP